MNIAIDGPAGAGKSTIARLTAEKLGFIYVDTGAMYRAIALYLLEHDVDIENEAALFDALQEIQIEIRHKDGVQFVYLNDVDVSHKIRNEAVGNMASKSSALLPVREKLMDLQRSIAASGDVIMDGRDIGTNVLPNAELKIYLTASAEVRAKRRFDELTEKGETPDFEEIRANIVLRDTQDMNRAIAPLKRADDAIYLDTSNLSIIEVVDKIIQLEREQI